MWPFRRRSEPPASTPAEAAAPPPPERRQDWAALTPLDASLAPHPLTIERDSFEGELAALAQPELLLAPLRHAVSEDAPAGVIADLVTAVDAPPASLPALPHVPMPLLHPPAPAPAPVASVPRRPLPTLRVAPAAPAPSGGRAAAPVQRAMVSAPPAPEPPRPLAVSEPAPVVDLVPQLPADAFPTTAPVPSDEPVVVPDPVADLALPLASPPVDALAAMTDELEVPSLPDVPLVSEAPPLAEPLQPAEAHAPVAAPETDIALPLATPPESAVDEAPARDVPILGEVDPMPRRLGLGEPVVPSEMKAAQAPPTAPPAAPPMPLPPTELREPKGAPAPKLAASSPPPTPAPGAAAPKPVSVQRATLAPSLPASPLPAPTPPAAPMPLAPAAKATLTVPLLGNRPLAPTLTEQVPGAVRAHVERTVGTALGDVRVHRGEEAAHHAAALEARAFTSDGEVHLPAAHGPLDRGPAQALLAHELVHVGQQKRMGGTRPAEHTATGQQLEREAQAVEHHVARHVDAYGSPSAALDATSPAPTPLPLPRPPAAARHATAPATPLLDPARVALDAGIATRAPDGSVLFNAPPAGAPQAPPPQRAVTAETSNSPPGVEATPVNIDVLYDKIRRRLKDELRVNRQRLGMNMDFGR